MAAPTFALNHMVAPQMLLGAFFELGKALGIQQFEIRNDLSGNAILDGTPPEAVGELAVDQGIEIISINALQRFNEWTPTREEEAKSLVAYAAACGAKALVLVPVNDGSGKLEGERQGNLRLALKGLKPILQAAGIIGLVEPLGFQICSLRSKKEAADAIAAIDGIDQFRLVHDTFHHVLAGEPDMFPAMTGLVHISGVDDQAVSIADMRDGHRVMVTQHDRLSNVTQIQALIAKGYAGPFSFEPFSPSVHATSDVAGMIRDSMNFVRDKL
ncbi:TIM barrel protein (plasmid) [Rhizobium sp. 32-5/1]|uniref:TIM barrel protein n=1 Tax=Rhizobium sp. 32-5/1 TaxID=3019602 RepID=UPI00240DDC17|nr:TIM barrel protein [Rhizobium sp. 32-5/1]WEZ85558.1 TIM barrel protein [Rhizobium sp. 32-5/1]